MFQGINDSDRKKIILAGISVGVTLAVYLIFKYCLILVTPFIIGLLLALAVKRPVFWLKRRFRIPVIFGTILVLLIFVGTGACFIIYVGSRFVAEMQKFFGHYDLYYGIAVGKICDMCCNIDEMFGFVDGRTFEMVENGVMTTINKVSSEAIPVLAEKTVNALSSMVIWGGGAIIAFTTLFVIIKDYEILEKKVKEGANSKWFRILFGRLSYFGGAYVKTQLLIMGITAVICTSTMYLIGNGYPVMIGILIGLLDALPFFGTGTVLIPWTLICLVTGNFINGAIIFTAYCLCYVIRELLEPHLMGGHMGIAPLIMLMTMYAGILLFGLFGFILGPVAYILVSEIMKYLRIVI